MSVVKAGRKELSRLAGGRAPKGRRGSHAHGNNTGRIHGQHKRVGKRGEVTLLHGKPLQPCGPPPLQGGGVFLRTDKRREAMRLTPNEYSSFVKSPSLATVPTKRGSGRMSHRGRSKFLFAGFGRISVTRLLSLQGKTEKRNRHFLHKTAPLCNVLWGIFTF